MTFVSSERSNRRVVLHSKNVASITTTIRWVSRRIDYESIQLAFQWGVSSTKWIGSNAKLAMNWYIKDAASEMALDRTPDAGRMDGWMDGCKSWKRGGILLIRIAGPTSNGSKITESKCTRSLLWHTHTHVMITYTLTHTHTHTQLPSTTDNSQIMAIFAETCSHLHCAMHCGMWNVTGNALVWISAR